MKFHYVSLIAVSALVFAACTPPAPTPNTTNASTDTSDSMIQTEEVLTTPMTKTFVLTEQNGSGQNGVATLSEGPAGNAVIAITVSGGDQNVSQPAHIHVGSCPNPGAVKYDLTNVTPETTETTLDASYEDIANATEKLAINIHKSAEEIGIYTACGNIN